MRWWLLRLLYRPVWEREVIDRRVRVLQAWEISGQEYQQAILDLIAANVRWVPRRPFARFLPEVRLR